MIFQPSELAGAFVLEPERQADERGYFARTFCREELARHRLEPPLDQFSISFNHRRGTLRGLHFQAAPDSEVKLIRVTRGAIFDVIVDLREESATFGAHASFELDADGGRQLYVPAGFAHGFQTLADATEVFYQISPAYQAGKARGYRWDSPELGIDWPEAPTMISERDAALPFFGQDGGS